MKVGVLHNNVYVFSAPTRDSKKSLRGNVSVRKVLNRIDGLQYPNRIKSTELTKYCATITQIADLSENDLNVHKEYYRLRESTVELSKVSRLLLAIDERKAGNLAGKKLNEIRIEGKLVVYIALSCNNS